MVELDRTYAIALVEPRMSLSSRLSPEVSSLTIVCRAGPSVLQLSKYSQWTEDVNQAQLTKNMGPLPCAKLFGDLTVSTSSPNHHQMQNREEGNLTPSNNTTPASTETAHHPKQQDSPPQKSTPQAKNTQSAHAAATHRSSSHKSA